MEFLFDLLIVLFESIFYHWVTDKHDRRKFSSGKHQGVVTR
jgi:hypothetical protein